MLKALILLQIRDGLTDGQMAQRLRCSRSYWNLIKNGRMPLPDSIAVRAAGVWPETTKHLIDIAEMSVMSVANRGKEVA